MAVFLVAQVASALAVDPAPTTLPVVPGVETEPNGTAMTASTIASEERIRAPLFPNGDVDYYRFSAHAGDRVFAALMTSGSAGSSSDSQLSLLGIDGSTVIEFDDDNGSQAGLSSSVAGATIPSDGTYYLKVNDFTAGTTSERPYDLYLQLRSGLPTAEAESNDTPATANPLDGGFVSGARNPAASAEVDFYSMQLEAGDTVFLSLDLDPERDGTTFNGRLGLGLFGDVDNQILVVNDAGAAETPNPTYPSEALFMTVDKPGTYYVFVDSADGAVGGPTATYQLSGTVLPTANPSCRTYPAGLSGSIFDGGRITFPISVGDTARIGRVAVHVDLTHALMANLDVSLRSPDGNEIGLFTDIGATATGGQTHLEATFDQSAAIPPAYTVLRPLMLQPETAYRLGWLEGEQAKGDWGLVVRDDDPDDNVGALASAELILCAQPKDEVAKQIFAADFESGDEGFTHSGTQDEWERGLPATIATATSDPVAGLSTCAQGFACFKTDLDDTYDASSTQDLVSPPISLAGVTGPIAASWEQWYQMESADFDHVLVSVEEDGGGSVRPLFTWLDATMKATFGYVIANPNHPAAAGWGLHRADISDYAGKTIRLRFHLDSDSAVNFAGLAVDDVRVYQPGAPPSPPGGGEPARGPEPEAGPGIGLQWPVISGLSIKPKRFRVARSGPRTTSSRKTRTGATVAYTDSQAAIATLTVFRVPYGLKAKARCCRAAYSKIGSFTHIDVAGRNQLHFSGRIKGRKLAPGKYGLKVWARARGGNSNTLSTTFTVLP